MLLFVNTGAHLLVNHVRSGLFVRYVMPCVVLPVYGFVQKTDVSIRTAQLVPQAIYTHVPRKNE